MLLENPKLLLTDKVGLIMLGSTIPYSALWTTSSKKKPSFLVTCSRIRFWTSSMTNSSRIHFRKSLSKKIPKYMLTYKFGLTILANTIRQSSLLTTTCNKKKSHLSFKSQTCVDQNLGGQSPWAASNATFSFVIFIVLWLHHHIKQFIYRNQPQTQRMQRLRTCIHAISSNHTSKPHCILQICLIFQSGRMNSCITYTYEWVESHHVEKEDKEMKAHAMFQKRKRNNHRYVPMCKDDIRNWNVMMFFYCSYLTRQLLLDACMLCLGVKSPATNL